jgi:hypothetical protein
MARPTCGRNDQLRGCRAPIVAHSANGARYFTHSGWRGAVPNFTLKLVRPGFGPAAEPPASPPAWRRHGGCSSRVGSANAIRGNRRAASALARGTGRTA